MSLAAQRLVACLEAFSHQEEGAIGHDDWPALAALLERQLEVATCLAEGAAPAVHDEALAARAEALRLRYAALQERIASARERSLREISEIEHTGRRLRAVRGAYGANAAPRSSSEAAAA